MLCNALKQGCQADKTCSKPLCWLCTPALYGTKLAAHCEAWSTCLCWWPCLTRPCTCTAGQGAAYFGCMLSQPFEYVNALLDLKDTFGTQLRGLLDGLTAVGGSCWASDLLVWRIMDGMHHPRHAVPDAGMKWEGMHACVRSKRWMITEARLACHRAQLSLEKRFC